MKKLVAVLLTVALGVSCLVGCGAKDDKKPSTPSKDSSVSADSIPDDMTSDDGKYQVALVTDIGQLKDGSFNESSWNGVKLFASENKLSYKYYQPANGNEATDDDRYDAMVAAVKGGAELIVAPGFAQATALQKVAVEYPEVHFLFLDGWVLTDADGNPLKNIAAVSYQEEQCGYFAGYAAVMDGYTKLGFAGGGGGTNAACCRYLYGYLQGASAAAKELDVQVEVVYTWLYGSNFAPSTELQTLMNGWYTNGTEVVFACGGSICQSVFAAAEANDGKTIGVDVDQANQSNTVINSALKGLAASIQKLAKVHLDGQWDTIGGSGSNLGAADNATSLATAESSWRFEKFTMEQYNKLFEDVVSGKLAIDAETPTEHGYDSLQLDNLTIKSDK